MLSQRLQKVSQRCIPVRCLQTVNMFLPNEQRHQFEAEKLTPEENKAAIPPKPDFSHVPKYHVEIIKPEKVADLVSRPKFNELFVTSLTEDSILFGKDHTVIPKDSSKLREQVRLLFTATTNDWIEVFNKEIIELSELPTASDSLHHLNVDTISILKKEMENVDAILSSDKNLDEFYDRFRAFRNSDRKMRGEIQQVELNSLITLEIIAAFLLSEGLVRDTMEFNVLAQNISKNIGLFSFAGLKTIYDIIANDSRYEAMTPNGLNDLLDTCLSVYPSLSNELAPSTLDKLASLLINVGNLPQAKKLLSRLIREHRISPSLKTLDQYMLSFIDQTENPLKEVITREFTDFKPVFFSKGLTEIGFKIILNTAIDNVFELDQFINLVELSDSRDYLLQRYATDLIKKLDSLCKSSNESEAAKKLYSAGLLRRLIIKDKISIQHEAF